MIDVHSHILYGLDDGAKNVQASLEMAREAVKEGIKVIYATPHHLNEKYENNAKDIENAVSMFNSILRNHSIPLTVRAGQEVRINGDLLLMLQEGSAMPLEGTEYVLVELPSNHVPRYTSGLLFDLLVAGYKPIIVHPERNSELVQKPTKLYEYVKKGALTQVTAGSVAGKFGKKIQKFSLDLIDANLTHFIASDAHNLENRTFYMNEAYAVIEKTFGLDTVFYLKENAEILAANEQVIGEPPERLKEKKKFGFFR